MKKASPHGGHVFLRIKILQTIFEKVNTRNNLVKLFQILTSGFGGEEFLRFSSCPYSAKSLPLMEAMLFNGSKIREQVLKRVSQGTILWNYFKIGPAVSEEKIFKEILKKFHFAAMATRVFDGIKFCKHFLKRTPKEHSCQVWFKLAQRFRRNWCLKKLLTTHDGHRVILKAPLEHVVLRWAKKKKRKIAA